MTFLRILFLITAFGLISTSAQDTTKVEITPYKLSEISTALSEADNSLRSQKSKLESSGDIDALVQEFRKLVLENDELRKDTSVSQYDDMTLTDLEQQKSHWTKYEERVKSIDKSLLKITHALEEYLIFLNETNEKWQLTSEEAEKSESIDAIKERIDDVISKLADEKVYHKTKSEQSFSLVDTVSQELLFISGIINDLKDTYDEKQSQIYVRDSPPFWEMSAATIDSSRVSRQLQSPFTEALKANVKLVRDNQLIFWLHILIFILITLFFFYVSRSLKLMTLNDEWGLERFSQFIQRPMALSIIFTLMISFWLYPDPPKSFGSELLLIVIIPITWVLNGTISKELRIAVIALAIAYFLEVYQLMMTAHPIGRRWIMLFEAIVGLSAAIYLSRPGSMIYKQQRKALLNSLRLVPLFAIFLAAAIYSNLVGAVIFSRLITSSIIDSVAVAVALYFFVTMLEGMMAYLIYGNVRNYVHVFESLGDEIMRWFRTIVRIWALYVWGRATLRTTKFYESFLDSWEQLMALGWDFGEVSLTMDLVVNFVLIIFFFSLIANLLRTLLEVEILPRFNLKKGVPMAIAVMTRYTVLVLGFFMAVAAAGISLDKLGFIAGALGVGIGFGLQNVVGNFVSGLILIFERPIHIGDVIVADNLEGVVKEVGIRSSKIRTWEGAEVIVPNSDLVSFKVTNWTLSDATRRREKHIRLEYGTDPNEVIEIVMSLLENREDVLKDPAPMVLFLGYMEYSIDFRILYWVNGGFLKTDSEVSLDIHNALKQKNIEVALPKQRMIMTEEKKPVRAKRAPSKPKNEDGKNENSNS